MTRAAMLKFLMLIVLIQFAAGANAQAVNVLTNPGFEESFTVRDGDQFVRVAEGWTPWHREAEGEDAFTWELIQPEYQSASDTDESSHIREGEYSQLLRSFYATFDAGLLQEYEGVEVNSWLRFSASAWVWSSKLDDPLQSEADGDVFVQVGIDPDGGTDGESEDIVWSEITYELYDGWRDFVVVTQATAETITVFIRVLVGQPVRNNFVWLDDTKLYLDAFDEDVVTSLAQSVGPPPLPTRIPVYHVVQAGETLDDVAAHYGTSVESILTANNLSGAHLVHTGNQLLIPGGAQPSTAAAVPGADDSVALYVVRAGDTFYGIASSYGIDVGELAQMNRGISINLLDVGQELAVPAVPVLPPSSRSYTVRRGETLLDIALRFSVSAEELASANNISVNSLLEVGQTLEIP